MNEWFINKNNAASCGNFSGFCLSPTYQQTDLLHLTEMMVNDTYKVKVKQLWEVPTVYLHNLLDFVFAFTLLQSYH